MGILDGAWVDELLIELEEATRSTDLGVRRFIEPAPGTLARAASKRPHMVFGRRGSGKSSLLKKAAADLALDRRPIALVEMETFKGHSYPDVLVSVLIETFNEFGRWLREEAIHPSNKISFWAKLFGKQPTRKPLNKKQAASEAAAFDAQVGFLKRVLHDPETVERNVSTQDSTQESSGGELAVAVHGLKAKSDAKWARSSSSERSDSYTSKKEEFLHRQILEYRELFKSMSKLSDGDSFLILDDIYHIRRADQAKVIDYFHRIAKGSSLWLKVGTIRHRSTWYIHGDPPMGMKLGDDADEIDLDLTLEKYTTARKFLLRVLASFLAALSEPKSVPDLLTEGAIDRLVLASGGVARDFLGILRKSIVVARERGGGPRGERVGAEDVNGGSGEYDASKREELVRDTLDEAHSIEEHFRDIRDFCVNRAKTNVFLFSKDGPEKARQMIGELVDLRLLHKVRSRVTVKSGRPGEIFEAYMLDVSQFTASRKTRDLEMIEFWHSKGEERLRRATLIYESRV